jgi:hypothetical protein
MTYLYFFLLSFIVVGILIKNAPVVEEEFDNTAVEN